VLDVNGQPLGLLRARAVGYTHSLFQRLIPLSPSPLGLPWWAPLPSPSLPPSPLLWGWVLMGFRVQGVGFSGAPSSAPFIS